MNAIEGSIIGFLIGSILSGFYIIWFIRTLKRNGYIVFEGTEKLRGEFESLKNIKVECPDCNGEGYYFFIDQGEPDIHSRCSSCSGTGKIAKCIDKPVGHWLLAEDKVFIDFMKNKYDMVPEYNSDGRYMFDMKINPGFKDAVIKNIKEN